MGQSDSISTAPPETGSDVNITVNENNGGTDEAPAETETPSTESNDSGDSSDSESKDDAKSE